MLKSAGMSVNAKTVELKQLYSKRHFKASNLLKYYSNWISGS